MLINTSPSHTPPPHPMDLGALCCAHDSELLVASWCCVIAGEKSAGSRVWEQLSVGEKIAGLHAVLSQQVDPQAAASFLAAIKDPVIREGEDNSKNKAEISWKYVESAYQEIIKEWAGLTEELYSVNEAHTLVCPIKAHICCSCFMAIFNSSSDG